MSKETEITKLKLKGMDCSLCEHRDYEFGFWCSHRQGPPPRDVCEKFELSNIEFLSNISPEKVLEFLG